MSRSFRQTFLALIAGVMMVTVICGFTSQGFSAHASGTGHSDWSMHFTGVSGSAPKPAPIARPVLAARVPPAVSQPAPRTPRRARAHLARGPPLQLHPASFTA